MAKKYRKKPVVVEAMQFTGKNALEVMTWANTFATGESSIPAFGEDFVTGLQELTIKTLEGTHEATPGDYIIRGVKNELYPCKPDIFEQTYEAV